MLLKFKDFFPQELTVAFLPSEWENQRSSSWYLYEVSCYDSRTYSPSVHEMSVECLVNRMLVNEKFNICRYLSISVYLVLGVVKVELVAPQFYG